MVDLISGSLGFPIPLSDQIESLRLRAAEHFGDAAVAELFERWVSRAWRVAREEINGHVSRAAAARAATAEAGDTSEGLHRPCPRALRQG